MWAGVKLDIVIIAVIRTAVNREHGYEGSEKGGTMKGQRVFLLIG